MAGPQLSVVIPTFGRREQVLRAVRALGDQANAGEHEVIVVVDGSEDGSAEALRELDPGCPLTVLEQSRQGAASARNKGASAARGELLLFLDDDMEADPTLLAEHERSHREGADVVIGHIPLHPDSPPTVISAAVGVWAEERARRLSIPGAKLTLGDLLVGQLSLRRATFDRLGGFDERFTRGGSYGNEDLDFGQRILDDRLRIVFNPAAVSRQRYVVTARAHLRQWRQTGRADVVLARKHPEQAAAIFGGRGADTLLHRLLWRPVVEVPGFGALLGAAVGRSAVVAARRDPRRFTRLRSGWFRRVRQLEYWRGVRDGGGIPRPRLLRVLSYHAVADLSGDLLLEDYGVPASVLRRQLDELDRLGYRFVAPAEVVCFLHAGGGLPRRPVLLTFDDCYESLRFALPVLAEHNAAAIAFAVSGLLGRDNEWDAALGARRLELLDESGLAELVEAGVELGAHSRTHRRLDLLSATAVREEVAGSIADLERLGHGRPRFFAYPYGVSDEQARTAVREAGAKAAFTTAPGPVRAGQDVLLLPRIEVRPGDVGFRLRRRVALAGRRRRSG